MIRKITAVIALFLLAGCTTQKPLSDNSAQPTLRTSALKFLVNIQERNFRKSAEFCDNHNTDVKSAFSHYLQQYRQGTRAGLEKVGEKDSLNFLPGESETEAFLDVQDRQGDNLLQLISASPDRGCSKLLSIFSALSAEDAEDQVLALHTAYLEGRKKYCSKIPVPDGCA